MTASDSTRVQVFEGLEGVLVARTELSSVEGERGRLSVRGRSIEDLAGQVPFESMALLLLEGELPGAERLAAFRVELGVARARAHARLAPTLGALCGAEPMSALGTALSLLAPSASAADVMAMAAVATAGSVRLGRGASLLEPNPAVGHAGDFLRLLHGRTPSDDEVGLLDTYWVTVAEHGFNASTFAARVTASTGATLPAAMVAGVAALSGPLHGGAPGPVLDMLDAVGTPENALSYVRAELGAGRRIMGMGHRVYRVRDPRAFVLERALGDFRGTGPRAARLTLARAVEATAEAELGRKHPDRALRANVEFYTALLLEALEIPRGAFTALFAAARVAGYAAHYAEQRARGRLIRPSALYVGVAVDEAARAASPQ